MGGCATKPKVLKDDDAPVPEAGNDEKTGAVPPPSKEEKTDAVPEVKQVEKPDVVVVDEITVTEGDHDKQVDKDKVQDQAVASVDVGEGDKVKEIVDDDKVDDQASLKRRSLSILFKENQEGKDSTGNDNPTVEPAKQEPIENEKPKDVLETKRSEEIEKFETPVGEVSAPEIFDAQKPKQSETLVEQTPLPNVVVAQKSEIPVVSAPEKAETEKIIETAPAAETKTDGTYEEKKSEAPNVSDANKKAEKESAIEAAPAVETQINGKSGEKKTEAKETVSEKTKV